MGWSRGADRARAEAARPRRGCVPEAVVAPEVSSSDPGPRRGAIGRGRGRRWPGDRRGARGRPGCRPRRGRGSHVEGSAGDGFAPAIGKAPLSRYAVETSSSPAVASPGTGPLRMAVQLPPVPPIATTLHPDRFARVRVHPGRGRRYHRSDPRRRQSARPSCSVGDVAPDHARGRRPGSALLGSRSLCRCRQGNQATSAYATYHRRRAHAAFRMLRL